MDLYGLFASEYDYRAVAAADLPLGDFAVEYGRTVGHFLHNHGALRSLERLLGLLHPEGLILVNDYGQTEVTRGDDFEHQRFAETTAVGLNFPLLKAYFAGGGLPHREGEAPAEPVSGAARREPRPPDASGRCQWVEPTEDNGRIHSRLLLHNPSPQPPPRSGEGEQEGSSPPLRFG